MHKSLHNRALLVAIGVLIATIGAAQSDYTNVDQLEMAVEARESGDYELAQKILDSLLEDTSDHIPIRYEQARLFAAQGDHEQAIRWLHRTLDLGGVVDSRLKTAE